MEVVGVGGRVGRLAERQTVELEGGERETAHVDLHLKPHARLVVLVLREREALSVRVKPRLALRVRLLVLLAH